MEETSPIAEQLDLIISRLFDTDTKIVQNAVQSLVTIAKEHGNLVYIKHKEREIYEAYLEIQSNLEKNTENNEEKEKTKQNFLILSDILSYVKNDLLYRHSALPIKELGHQYVKEMLKQLIKLQTDKQKNIESNTLIDLYSRLEIVEKESLEFLINTNSEIDCIDYLLEINQLSKIVEYTDDLNKKRIILYLEGLIQAGDIGGSIISTSKKQTQKDSKKDQEEEYETYEDQEFEREVKRNDVDKSINQSIDSSIDVNIEKSIGTGEDLQRTLIKIFEKHDLFIDQLLFHIKHADLSRVEQFIETLSENHKLQANFILDRLKLKKFANNSEIVAQKEFGLKRTACNSSKTFTFIGECFKNFGIGNEEQAENDSDGQSVPNRTLNESNQSGPISEMSTTDETPVEFTYNMPDNYFLGLPLVNSFLDFSKFNSDIHGLLALAMNKVEEEEVTLALIQEKIDESIRMFNENRTNSDKKPGNLTTDSIHSLEALLLCLFVLEKYDLGVTTDSLYDILLNDDLPLGSRALAALVLSTEAKNLNRDELVECIVGVMEREREKFDAEDRDKQEKEAGRARTYYLILSLALSVIFLESGSRQNIFKQGEKSKDSNKTKDADFGLASVNSRGRPVNLIRRLVKSGHFMETVILILGMCYQGTGDISIIEEILSIGFGEYVQEPEETEDEEPETDPKDENIKKIADNLEELNVDDQSSQHLDEYSCGILQSVALLAISLISMGNETTAHLCSRLVNSTGLKRAIPLCYSVLFSGTGNKSILDELCRGVTGAETNILVSKLIGIALVGSGSNSSTILSVLDSIKRCPFRGVSSGLIELAHGTCDTALYKYGMLNQKGLIGVLLLCITGLEGENSILCRDPFYILSIVPSIRSKIISYVTTKKESEETDHGETSQEKIKKVYTEEDKPYRFISKECTVGKKTSIVGLKGNPREITGIYKITAPFTLKYEETGESTGMRHFEGVIVDMEE